MNRLRQHLVRAGGELGIKIIAPFELRLGSGRRLLAEALLPQLGAPKGMIVTRSYDDIRDLSTELESLNYGFSVMDEPPPNEVYDLDDYVELFRDWGWASEEDKPHWIE